MKGFAKNALALLLALALSVPALALSTDADVFYQQLSPAARRTFDYLNAAECLAKFRSGSPIQMSLNGAYSTSAEREQVYQRCFDAINDAYSAILEVHPELFWLSGISTHLNGKDTGSMLELTATITPRFQAEWSSGSRSVYTDEAVVNAAVEKLAEEARSQGGVYEQLLYVHDWLTQHNVYNNAASAVGTGADYLPWTPLSALTDSSQPVCEGYSRAFKMVCDKLGIPCLLVFGAGTGSGGSSGAHGWNQVMVDGKWYAVDVTFDDPMVESSSAVYSGYENHTCFLAGSNSIVFSGMSFSGTHFPDGKITQSTSFSYPALSSEAYKATGSVTPTDPVDPNDPYDPYDPGEPQDFQFADVSDSAYYSEAVQWAVGVGVTNGTGTDSKGVPLFSPNSTVTRGQAVTFLWRAMWEPEPETTRNPFRDVKNGDYYYDAVLWAVENGITNGTGAATFSPGDPVTRGQMLTFLWRTLGKPGETGNYSGKQWYEDAENWGEESGCIYGTAQPYSTNAKCPRSDVVFYLWQAMMSLPD